MTMAPRTERIANIDLLIRDGDAQQTIFFLHGIGGRASSFADVMQHWRPGPRLIAWDMPGYGGSAPLATKWATPRHFATKLVNLIEDLDAKGCDILGQSLGGLIAGYAAAVVSDYRIHRRLVLVSPALGYKAPQTYPLPAALAQRLDDFEREGPVDFASKRATRLVHDAGNHPEVTARVRAAMASLSSEGHRAAVQALAAGDLLSIAAAIPDAVLLVSGIEDVVTPLAGTRGLLAELAKRPRQAGVHEALVEIPQAGHAAYLEARQAFMAAIERFLTEEAS